MSFKSNKYTFIRELLDNTNAHMSNYLSTTNQKQQQNETQNKQS